MVWKEKHLKQSKSITTMTINYFHFHLYFSVEQMQIAKDLASKIHELFSFKIGRLWDRPIGPHPVCSCQVSVPVEKFDELVFWILENRSGISFFIHPVTGDDFLDHSERAIWIGKSYELDLDIFCNGIK